MPTSEEAQDWLAHAIANDELAHFGVLGMRWGVRKSEPSVRVTHKEKVAKRKAAIERNTAREKALDLQYEEIRKTKDRNARKQMLAEYAKKESLVVNHPDARIAANHELKRAVVGAAIGTAAYLSIVRGGAYLASHPEIFDRASRLVKNQKAIERGYKVVQMTLKNGTYVLKR